MYGYYFVCFFNAPATHEIYTILHPLSPTDALPFFAPTSLLATIWRNSAAGLSRCAIAPAGTTRVSIGGSASIVIAPPADATAGVTTRASARRDRFTPSSE